MKRIIILTISAFLGISLAFAGGSVSFDEQLLPILKQNKEFSDAILSTFDFNASVYGQSDFGDHTRFGGERLGPYTLLAKPKSSKSGWIFEVTINTRWTIYDANGNQIPLRDESGKMTGIFDPKATRIEETFESIELKPYKENKLNQGMDLTREAPLG
ncbi:MAG: hypothetical protein GXY61_12560 [Lentisphaerae bacterium]|jgi:hypothetical protein|nr:hypothetical protein [Lentisphaerota bacterium]